MRGLRVEARRIKVLGVLKKLAGCWMLGDGCGLSKWCTCVRDMVVCCCSNCCCHVLIISVSWVICASCWLGRAFVSWLPVVAVICAFAT